MNDMGSLVAANDTKVSVKETINFSKKNAWKSEWEKAQMEVGKNNDQVNDKKVNKHAEADIELKENNKLINSKVETDVLEHSLSPENATNSIVSATDQNVFSTVIVSPALTLDNAYLTTKQISNAYVNNTQKSTASMHAGKQETSNVALVFDVEAKLTSKYKLQNLNIVMTENGARVLMRDYRLDKTQLTKAMEEIKAHLGEFGIEVKQTIINGVAS